MCDDTGEQLIDEEGVKEFFENVEHELKPSPIELRTLRHILATYKFTPKAKLMMEERCGLGPDPPIWDAILCYFGFIFVIVAIFGCGHKIDSPVLGEQASIPRCKHVESDSQLHREQCRALSRYGISC